MGSENDLPPRRGAHDPARTETAVASAPPASVGSLGASLGRYRLERPLGAGAMGIVHAAFDSDLHREVALKVLHGTQVTEKGRARFLREARAMARLAHPCVVTVYEVGTAHGRDFIAMELIRGETLAAWLRAARRPLAAILDAFLAAGRGLVAAHAAGIVHRDFKPHNVLRSEHGRIAVTDFGLARACDDPAPIESDGGAERAPAPLAELTATGSLLGTPSYMAPEQWRGGAVTAATDQFAYCVALWEAIAGQRPYGGPTMAALRAQIERGPAALDTSRIPHRVRGLLLRGLDPDPARRWPSMEILLARLARARRPRWRRLALVGGALAALAWTLTGHAPPPACEPPVRDPTMVWSPAIAADLRAQTSAAHVAVLDAAYRGWQAARIQVCAGPPRLQRAQLPCLDGVLTRLDVIRQAFARVPDSLAEDVQANLVDPAVCRKPAAVDVPRLTLVPTPPVVEAYARYAGSEAGHPSEDEALAGANNRDPCARVIATLAYDLNATDLARARALTADASGAADQCGDERLRADLRLQESLYQWELPIVGARGAAAIERAQLAAARVMQPELDAALALQRVVVARQRGRWDDAFRWAETALADDRARAQPVRYLRASIERNRLRIERGRPDDLDAIVRDARSWQEIRAPREPMATLLHKLAIQVAVARFWRGEVAGGHATLIRLQQAEPSAGARRIVGEVVDRAGRPVRDARVAVASSLFADSVGIGVPAFAMSEYLLTDLRLATSDAGGHFVIEDAPPTGAIAAELGDRRSRPTAAADRVRLVLEPTRRVSGKVDLAGTAHTQVRILGVFGDTYESTLTLMAPVDATGAFVIEHAPIGTLSINAVLEGSHDAPVTLSTVPASATSVTGLSLSLAASTRVLDVGVRSAVDAPLTAAAVAVFAGVHHFATLDDLMRGPVLASGFAITMADDQRPATLRAGDLVAHFDHARPGDLTVCALNFSGDWMDARFRQHWQAHLAKVPFSCAHVGPGAAVVAIDVQPRQRFDN